MRSLLLLVVLCVGCVVAQSPRFLYGYLPNLDRGAYFYAFYQRTTVPVSQDSLTLFLQGGPGASSLFSDQLETGPYDVYGNPRLYAWTNLTSMLYVDNPIGTGFSWANPNGFSTTDEDVADGLVRFLTLFMQRYPSYQTVPLWIMSESYGGKMASMFGRALFQAIAAKKLRANFKGVGLGDGWVDPIACMQSYGPFLRSLSLLDGPQEAQVNALATQAAAAVAAGHGREATDLWGQQQQLVSSMCAGCNWYDALNLTDTDALESQLNANCAAPSGSFYRTIANVVPPNVTFNSQGGIVFDAMSDAFMLPAVDAVEFLLNNGVQVHVYNGQVDLIVDVLCTEQWVNSMTQWPQLTKWQQQQEQPIYLAGVPQGFKKTYQNFTFWKVFRASHMVPYSNPSMAYEMMRQILISAK